ncbi:hypothetical protein WMF18_41900 [Sorangium sp. So ce315]|uniref:hypothetical protein n=1 Tax=Sorangium sp. So ce315 TaxID=3133299 RepID=UPI003F6331D3
MERRQGAREAPQVLAIARLAHVDVVRRAARALNYQREPADDHEIDMLTAERFNDAPKVGDHGLPSLPR